MSEKIKLFGHRFGSAYMGIAIFLAIDLLTNLHQLFLDVQAGSRHWTFVEVGIWTTATGISLLNTIKAAQSGAWARAIKPAAPGVNTGPNP